MKLYWTQWSFLGFEFISINSWSIFGRNVVRKYPSKRDSNCDIKCLILFPPYVMPFHFIFIEFQLFFMSEGGAVWRWQSGCDRIYVANVVSMESLPPTSMPCQYQCKAARLLWKMPRQTGSKKLWCVCLVEWGCVYLVTSKRVQCVYVMYVCVCGPIKASLLTFLLQVSGGWIYGACLEAWGGLAGHELDTHACTHTCTLIHTLLFKVDFSSSSWIHIHAVWQVLTQNWNHTLLLMDSFHFCPSDRSWWLTSHTTGFVCRPKQLVN